MKQFLQVAIIALVFVMSAATVQAQKFGYLNSAEIVATMPEVKQMQSNLEGLQTQLQKKGQLMLTDYQQKEKAAVEKQQKGQLSPMEQETVMKELQDKQQEIMKFEQEMAQKLAAKEQELLKPILDRVNQAIKDVAKEDGYQFIFDTTSGALLYADESQDVTSRVKSKLGI